MKYKWKNYPEETPTDSGYYFTVHLEKDKRFYKAIWWEAKTNTWVHWRPIKFGADPSPDVIGFVSESRNDYYAPCVTSISAENCSEYGK